MLATDTKAVSSGPADRIRMELARRGATLGRWGIAHGFGRDFTYQVVKRWAGRTDKAPRGAIAAQIMAALRRELGPDLVPIPRSPKP